MREITARAIKLADGRSVWGFWDEEGRLWQLAPLSRTKTWKAAKARAKRLGITARMYHAFAEYGASICRIDTVRPLE